MNDKVSREDHITELKALGDYLMRSVEQANSLEEQLTAIERRNNIRSTVRQFMWNASFGNRYATYIPCGVFLLLINPKRSIFRLPESH